MRTEVDNFKRQDLFELYNSRTNPFSMVTTKIDITNIYKKCQKYKHYYATIGYYLTLAMNEVEEFKYRYENGKIIKYDNLRPNFTELLEDKTISFFTCELGSSYEEYLNNYDEAKKKLIENRKWDENVDEGEVWLSCQPWYNFSGLIPPFDKSVTIPQMIWDKFSFEDNKCYINLMIMSHHGFVDGYHIGKLINKINEVISNISEGE